MKQTLLALVLALVAGSSEAAICYGNGGGGKNIVYGDIVQATACDGMLPGNNLPPGNPFEFGKVWAYLDTQSGTGGDPFEGALILTGNGTLGGTWAIDLSKLAGSGYNYFMISLKPDGGFGYWLTGSVLSGTWNTDTPDSFCAPGGQFAGDNCAGFGLSHATLYGFKNGSPPPPPPPPPVPEPATLSLLGVGMAGLFGMRRKHKRKALIE